MVKINMVKDLLFIYFLIEDKKFYKDLEIYFFV